MARTDPKKDVVIIGLGWNDAILGMELVQEELEMLALERGPDRETVPDFQYPKVIDELNYGIRFGFMQKPKNSTVTIRRSLTEEAQPQRQLGSFLAGDGVGGAGILWNGQTWRPMEVEFRLKSYVEETFGTATIPDGMTIQDWGVSYGELEPHFVPRPASPHRLRRHPSSCGCRPRLRAGGVSAEKTDCRTGRRSPH